MLFVNRTSSEHHKWSRSYHHNSSILLLSFALLISGLDISPNIYRCVLYNFLLRMPNYSKTHFRNSYIKVKETSLSKQFCEKHFSKKLFIRWYLSHIKTQNLFKVNNKDTRTTSMTPFWCLYC